MYWFPVILILPYLLLLLRIYRNLLKIKPFNASASASAYVSVIIACRNERNNLPVLLDCISGQDYPREHFEVIIVDDNSTDETYETAAGYKGLIRLFAIKNRKKGKKEAIRTGINASKGNLIITTDADCTMGKNWIKTIVSFHEKFRPDMIICPVQIRGTHGFPVRFQELEFLGLQGITAATATAGKGIMCNGANLAFTREAYLKHMDNLHFELPTGDDVFFLHSLKREINSGILWLESADALVTTASSSTIWSFLWQRKRWISKWKAYDDRFTRLTGFVTFTAILLELSVFASIFFNISFIGPFLAILVMKSFPDYLILQNTSRRYGKKHLMCWFLPAQLVYPLYVLAVSLLSLVPSSGEGD